MPRRSVPKLLDQATLLRDHWQVSPGLRNLLIAMAVFSGVLLVGILGYWVFAGWSFLDALYMVVITIFGVGFGEVRPLDTPLLIVPEYSGIGWKILEQVNPITATF